LETDLDKLRRLRSIRAVGRALVGDATAAPLRDRSVALVISKNMSHHLNDEQLAAMLSEAQRLLCDDGWMIFVDAVWSPRRPISRLLWRYDRGAFPRAGAALQALLLRYFEAAGPPEHFAVWHRYLLWVGRPQHRA
jgi:ubiquinone/menaquinone biosynthesis C-methylase UbiE